MCSISDSFPRFKSYKFPNKTKSLRQTNIMHLDTILNHPNPFHNFPEPCLQPHQPRWKSLSRSTSPPRSRTTPHSLPPNQSIAQAQSPTSQVKAMPAKAVPTKASALLLQKVLTLTSLSSPPVSPASNTKY